MAKIIVTSSAGMQVEMLRTNKTFDEMIALLLKNGAEVIKPKN